MKEVMEKYKNYINEENLKTQLQILASTVPATINSIVEIIAYLRELATADKELIKEVITIVKITMVMPATNSTSERSFSAMRRIKTYLRSTILWFSMFIEILQTIIWI